MAHDLSFDINGKVQMAYAGDTPWHGLGQALTAGAPLDTWIEQAGFNYEVLQAPLHFATAMAPNAPITLADKVACYRSDTGAYLSTVGTKYNIVQPRDIAEFFREACEKLGYEMVTMGVLNKGTKYWALAKTGQTGIVGKKGKHADRIESYVLLCTACDGSLRTTGLHTSVRVVCANTLSAATNSAPGSANAVRVSHSSKWTSARVDEMRTALGIDGAWATFMENINKLADTPVTPEVAQSYIVDVLGDPLAKTPPALQLLNTKAPAMAWQLYNGKGRGAELPSAHGTAWGLLNAVTEYVDYFDGGNQSARLERSWFMGEKNIKNNAMRKALELVAA